MDMYELVYEELQDRVDSGELTLEQAEELNDIAYNKYWFESLSPTDILSLIIEYTDDVLTDDDDDDLLYEGAALTNKQIRINMKIGKNRIKNLALKYKKDLKKLKFKSAKDDIIGIRKELDNLENCIRSMDTSMGYVVLGEALSYTRICAKALLIGGFTGTASYLIGTKPNDTKSEKEHSRKNSLGLAAYTTAMSVLSGCIRRLNSAEFEIKNNGKMTTEEFNKYKNKFIEETNRMRKETNDSMREIAEAEKAYKDKLYNKSLQR